MNIQRQILWIPISPPFYLRLTNRPFSTIYDLKRCTLFRLILYRYNRKELEKMKKILWKIPGVLIVFALCAFVFPFNPASADDQERDRDRDRMRTQSYEQEHIYGSQLMTEQEREQYQHNMRAAKTEEERERIRNEHHERMMQRAKERGVTLPDEPYEHGMGGGMHHGMESGGGMGHDMDSGGGMGHGGGKGMGK